MNYLEQIGLVCTDWSGSQKRTVFCSTKYQIRIVFVLSLASTFLLSCAVDNEYLFKSPKDAISKYQSYASELHDKSSCSTDELIDAISHWQELSDTVYGYVSRDSSFTAHVHLSSVFAATSDSIRLCLLRLADSSVRTYSDILQVKERTSAFRNDTTLLIASVEALNFYDSFSDIKLRPESREEALVSYSDYVGSVSKDGIHSMDELCRFIKIEDVLFRGFLDHLSEYEELSLSDVTSSTESICRQIFESANAGDIDSKDVMIRMAVRTNRRLLQNAQVCIDDIKKGRVKSDAQMAAYQWMTIQPFVALDGFSVALLTDQQKVQLRQIAIEFQKTLSSSKLDDVTRSLMTDELPKQILKLYISSL